METLCKTTARDILVLQNVGDAGARKLEAEIDPEGPDHDERSGDSQHSPWRHLIHEIGYFKHLKQRKIDCWAVKDCAGKKMAKQTL